MSGAPVVLYAEFTALPGADGRVGDLVVALADRVRAEAGNVVFIAHRQQTHPSVFFVYEEYVNEAAFAAHVASVHCAEFNEVLVSLVEGGGSRVTFLEKI